MEIPNEKKKRKEEKQYLSNKDHKFPPINVRYPGYSEISSKTNTKRTIYLSISYHVQTSQINI